MDHHLSFRRAWNHLERGETKDAFKFISLLSHSVADADGTCDDANIRAEITALESVALVLQVVVAGQPLERASLDHLQRACLRLEAGKARRIHHLAALAVLPNSDLAALPPSSTTDILDSTILGFGDIRRSLSILDHETARAQLAFRHKHRMVTPWDDLFWMRLYLIEGRFDKAVECLHRMLPGVEEGRASGRLEFELDLARELNPCDLLALGGQILRPRSPADLAPIATAEQRLEQSLVGSCAAMSTLRSDIARLAPWDHPVLILGETGVGKELVARALHTCSPRRDLPFLAVNCAAVAESLLESELFGHLRGSFTGAESDRQGVLTAAGRGIVFLDEIGDTSLSFQASLLRLLESGEFRPVGADTVRHISCRIVAATHRNLPRLIEAGTFREDLYYRLRRLELVVPALRDRSDDIPVLALHFLRRLHPLGHRAALSEDLVLALSRHPWPGNVRELRNDMESMVIRSPDRLIYDVDDWRGSCTLMPHVSSRPEHESSLVNQNFGAGNPRMRRLDQVRALFQQHKRLTRLEVIDRIGISTVTATAYLKDLIAEGRIRKVEPTPSPSTHYFEAVDDPSLTRPC